MQRRIALTAEYALYLAKTLSGADIAWVELKQAVRWRTYKTANIVIAFHKPIRNKKARLVVGHIHEH